MDHHFLCDPEVKDGYTFIPWIADIFGDCVYTPTDKLSFGFGTLSLLLFILSYYPQLKRNWERKNVEGLSLGLLMLWLFGDLFNLSGASITKQLPIQIYIAIYFVSFECVLLAQYFYYRYLAQRQRGHYQRLPGQELPTSSSSCSESDEETVFDSTTSTNDLASTNNTRHNIRRGSSLSPSRRALFISTVCLGLLTSSAVSLVHNLSSTSTISPQTTPEPTSPSVLILGDLLAWTSGLLYFTSRIPQIIENNRQKSVHGLALSMFTMTWLANAAYGLSILLRFPPIDTKFWAATLPYLAGSLGTMALDTIIFVQAWMFDLELRRKVLGWCGDD